VVSPYSDDHKKIWTAPIHSCSVGVATGIHSLHTLLFCFSTLHQSIPTMHVTTSSSLLVAAALTGLASAATIPDTKQAFSVQQVPSGEKVVKEHPAKALLAVYQKYGAVDAAPTVLKAAAKTAAAASAASTSNTGSAAAVPASTFDEVSPCWNSRLRTFLADMTFRNTTAPSKSVANLSTSHSILDRQTHGSFQP